MPENEFRIMIVKMIQNFENDMEEMQESMNKPLVALRNQHTETITEFKNTLEGIKSRVSEAENGAVN